MAKLRPNRVKAKLMRGEPATVVAGTITPDLIEFFGNLGFDGVWLEAEHGPVDYGDIGDLSRGGESGSEEKSDQSKGRRALHHASTPWVVDFWDPECA